MDERIKRIFACPYCQKHLTFNVTDQDKMGIREGGMSCPACGKSYRITQGVFDLRPGVRLRAEEGKMQWNLDKCEQDYASIGLYKSSQDWARIRGVPVDVVDFIHRYVKGQLIDWAHFGASDAIVDVGCGVGHFLLDLRAQHASPDILFIGMDVAFPRVLAMRRRCEQEGITNVLCVAGDSESLPFASDSINHVTCTEVLEHVYHPERAIAEMCRVLKPSGMLLISTPSGNASRNWEHLVQPIRWARNLIAKPARQGTEAGYDVPIDLSKLRKYLIDSHLEVLDFELQPILPCEHFFKQIPPRVAQLIVPVFRLINHYLPLLRGQLGLHAVIQTRKNPSLAMRSN